MQHKEAKTYPSLRLHHGETLPGRRQTVRQLPQPCSKTSSGINKTMEKWQMVNVNKQ